MRAPTMLAGCGWLMATCLFASHALAESYQPRSNVTRGIYARFDGAVGTSVWRPWAEGFTFADDRPHSGEACVRCRGTADALGQGVAQTIALDQTEPTPVKIAGWSRAEGVSGAESYRYSLYVDFTLADGASWPMKLATFDPGTHDWEYAETVVTPPKPIRSARFHAFLREIDGTVWFDDLFFGEVDGPNLLRCPGFEKADRVDLAAREKLLGDLERLHANALHGYLSGTLDAWDEPPSDSSELVAFLQAAKGRGVGVWLTLGLGTLPVRNAEDPNFPQYSCVNGDWGRRWTESLAKAARYPFAGLSVVPDEYNWNNGRLQRAFAKHSDPKVRQFYANLGTYCDCPECRRRFTAEYGQPFPERLPRTLPSADLRHRRWLRFRYDSTTDWLRRTCAAVKAANPAIRTDSLICVTPICSDFWYGPGIAWDRAGYEAGLEYATIDPYIQLHNYLGDSTHWYVTETTEHLAAAGPQRRCGIVLEASRLRREHREIDPVEIYGSALSAVWHGADELAWWHYSHVMDVSHTTARADVSRACVRGVYGLLEKIDPWLEGVTPRPGVAVLFSRASCDLWRLYVDANEPEPPFDTRGVTDPRYASIVQKELLYLLFRTGVPATVYYLESVRPEELNDHQVILVPFPLAVDAAKAELLARLARQGKRVVVFGTDGPLDEEGTSHKRPALAGLIAAGQAAFVPPEVLPSLPASRENEKRTRTERIVPPPLDAEAARRVLGAVRAGAPAPVGRPLLADRLPEGDDVEVCLSTNRRGDLLLLAINWDNRERTVELPPRPCFAGPPAEAYLLGPDGNWAPWQDRLQRELRLKPQEALVARLQVE